MKKWKNRGHEFDELGQKFIKNHRIVLIGDKKCCDAVKEKLLFLETKINILEEKHFKTSINIFDKLKLRNKTVIVVDSNPYEAGLFISEMEEKLNLKRNINIFWSNDFFDKYLSIFAVYVSDKVYFPSNSFICTTVCNLNCKNCLNFKPYDRNTHHYNIEKLKKSIDIYFSIVDRVGLFHISGGEPFLYPHLQDLITYIGEKYNDKIDILGTVTNSTVMPCDDLCYILRKYNVRVEVDDYTQTIPILKNNYSLLLNKLKEYNIFTQINTAGVDWKWFATLPSRNDMRNAPESVLIKKFEECGNPFMEFKINKIHLCCYSEFASQAGLIKQKPSDFYDLSQFDTTKKKELVEFRLRFSEKGYAEFCRYCNGFPAINSKSELPAEQAHGKLSWDMNDPCNIQKWNTND